jgi:hypothetical protein
MVGSHATRTYILIYTVKVVGFSYREIDGGTMRIYKTTHRDIAMSLPLIMRFYDQRHSDLAMYSQQMKVLRNVH